MYKSILIIALVLGSITWSYSQTDPIDIPETTTIDTSGQDSLSVIIMNADTSIHVSYEDQEVDTLYKNVILTQDSLAMY